MMPTLTRLENKLIEEGIESFTLEEKNMLIQFIARRNAIPVNQVTDECILEHHKKIKREIFRNKCQTRIRNGFKASNGHTYRAEFDDQINFMGKMIHLIADPEIESVLWKTEDSGYKEHSREEWTNVFIEGLKHKEDNIFKYNHLLERLDDAKTHEEVIKIAWED